jgi:hypothetical protein
MSLMSFFCRLLNGKCAQETREPDRESYPKPQQTAASPARYPPPPDAAPPSRPPGTTDSLG